VEAVAQHQPDAEIFVVVKVVVDVLSLFGVRNYRIRARNAGPRGHNPRVCVQQKCRCQRGRRVYDEVLEGVGVERGHAHGPAPPVVRFVQSVEAAERVKRPVRVVEEHVREQHAPGELPETVREREVAVIGDQPREQRDCRDRPRGHISHDFFRAKKVALLDVPRNGAQHCHPVAQHVGGVYRPDEMHAFFCFTFLKQRRLQRTKKVDVLRI
tara:strand:+ start:6525 stop:7160 length:636 start_codon:yes stop_codon:yes gene_type:complete